MHHFLDVGAVDRRIRAELTGAQVRHGALVETGQFRALMERIVARFPMAECILVSFRVLPSYFPF